MARPPAANLPVAFLTGPIDHQRLADGAGVAGGWRSADETLRARLPAAATKGTR